MINWIVLYPDQQRPEIVGCFTSKTEADMIADRLNVNGHATYKVLQLTAPGVINPKFLKLLPEPNTLAEVFGTWPGDESDEELLRLLDEID